jgi:hypothetical protein
MFIKWGFINDIGLFKCLCFFVLTEHKVKVSFLWLPIAQSEDDKYLKVKAGKLLALSRNFI